VGRRQEVSGRLQRLKARPIVGRKPNRQLHFVVVELLIEHLAAYLANAQSS